MNYVSTTTTAQSKHLGTPRLITDQQQNPVWRWDNQEPFGTNPPNENPTGNGPSFRFNLRFPGQYFDKETNLNYNCFRDYDSTTGRYIQSDPIGLAGGINTYSYVDANPLVAADPMGLFKGPSGGGGGGGNSCILISETLLAIVPPGAMSVWLCAYDCNQTCPGSADKLHTEIQWDVWPKGGCYKLIPRPVGK